MPCCAVPRGRACRAVPCHIVLCQAEPCQPCCAVPSRMCQPLSFRLCDEASLTTISLANGSCSQYDRSAAVVQELGNEDTVTDLVLDLGDSPATTHCFRNGAWRVGHPVEAAILSDYRRFGDFMWVMGIAEVMSIFFCIVSGIPVLRAKFELMQLLCSPMWRR